MAGASIGEESCSARSKTASDAIGYEGYLITEQSGGDSFEGLSAPCLRLEKIITA